MKILCLFLDQAKAYEIPKDGVQINLEIEGAVKRTSKEIDVEACMKRKLNTARKQYQVYLHKVGLVCWISHGNYVNRVINSTTLMSMLNKLIPKQWYPKERTNYEYFEKIAVWFKNTICLKNKDMYSKLTKRPDLPISLALQIQQKTVICRRDFLLLFVCLLRSMGIQSRMVMSLGVESIRPPQSELMSLAKKDVKPSSGQSKVASNSRNSTVKPSSSKSAKSSGSSKATSSSSTKKTTSGRNKVETVKGNNF